MGLIRVLVVAGSDDHPKLSDFTKEGVTKKVELMDNSLGLRNSICQLVHSDLVVTAGEWHSDKNCVSIVDIARKLKTKVIHESRFKEYAEENHN